MCSCKDAYKCAMLLSQLPQLCTLQQVSPPSPQPFPILVMLLFTLLLTIVEQPSPSEYHHPPTVKSLSNNIVVSLIAIDYDANHISHIVALFSATLCSKLSFMSLSSLSLSFSTITKPSFVFLNKIVQFSHLEQQMKVLFYC